MKNILLISLLCCLSCSKQEVKLFVLPAETPIESIDYPNEIVMKYPWSIDIIDDKLLICASRDEHIMRIVDANDGREIKQTGIFGNGPGEFTQPEYLGFSKDKEVYMYDQGPKCIRKYSWDDILNEAELPKTDGSPIKNKDLLISAGRLLDNGNLATSTVVGLPKPIATLDKNLNVQENMGNIPDKEHQSNALITYGGYIGCYENKFVLAMASLTYIACYEQQPDGTSKLLWERYAELPVYKKDQLDIRQLLLAFSNVKMTRNYIFCSYFGQKYVRENRQNIKPRNILVFDHKGNLLKNFRSERSIGKLTVSEDEKTIYALTEEPEVAIIRFDISNLIK